MSISKKDPISPKEETEKGCQGFVLGFLKDTLKFCCFPVPAPQDGALSWKETGSKKGGQYKYYCISLASSGDVTVGQVEKGTKKKIPDFLQLPVAFFVFSAGLSLENMRHHFHHAAHFSILCGHMLQKFSC